MSNYQQVKNIVIFASGGGSNASKIISHFKNRSDVEVALVLSNKVDSNVLNIAKENSIETLVVDRESFYKSDTVVKHLKGLDIDLVVLAGFLWLIPKDLIKAFPERILNIHPALLPKYGGKGMYGQNIHKAVFEAKEKESGITIHIVNEKYDEGKIIFQAHCNLSKTLNAEEIGKKVLELEHKYYPLVVENYLDRV